MHSVYQEMNAIVPGAGAGVMAAARALKAFLGRKLVLPLLAVRLEDYPPHHQLYKMQYPKFHTLVFVLPSLFPFGRDWLLPRVAEVEEKLWGQQRLTGRHHWGQPRTHWSVEWWRGRRS